MNRRGEPSSARLGSSDGSEIPALPPQQWSAALRGVVGGSRILWPLHAGEWRGQAVLEMPLERAWSGLNGAQVALEEWQIAWPQVQLGLAGAWRVLKRDRAGIVAHGALTLAGREVAVVAKQPLRTRASHLLVDAFRGSRARRTWRKTWQLYVRGLPTEIPLLVMERKRGPLVLENVAVFEHVPGSTIFHANLDTLGEEARAALFRRVGATLRRIEALGFSHRDAKTTNWIIFEHHPERGEGHDALADTGPLASAPDLIPVMLDCYGVRRFGGAAAGLDRFLRALVRHRQCCRDDVSHVCNGYAPAGPEAWSDRVRRLHEHYASRAPC